MHSDRSMLDFNLLIVFAVSRSVYEISRITLGGAQKFEPENEHKMDL